MTTGRDRSRALLLLASGDEWFSRSVGAVLEEHGFAVERTVSSPLALAFARRVRPDVVMLDDQPGELDAITLCQALRDDPLFDPATPVVVASGSHAVLPRRMAAFEAGAWIYCSQPLDLDMLSVQLRTFLRARRSRDARRAFELTDSDTGLYTAYGLQQFMAHLRARALREREPLACIALDAGRRDQARGRVSQPRRDGESGFVEVANICRIESRAGDVVGRLAENRLAIIAPGTGPAGVRTLIHRLQGAVHRAAEEGRTPGELQLRAGYAIVDGLSQEGGDAADLLRRAQLALELLDRDASADGVLGFDDQATH